MSGPWDAAGFDVVGESTGIRALLRAMVANRELVTTLARKEFSVRYRRASFGIAWAVALPLVQALVLAFVFSRFVRFETSVGYGLFVYAGMIVWSFFVNTVQAATVSIVENSTVTTRIYFPRALLPLVTVGASLYGFVAGLPVLVALLAVDGWQPGPEVLLVVPAVALVVVLTSGMGLLLSVAHVYFRDVRFLVAAVTTPMFYATPVFYPYGAISGVLELVNIVNPMTGVVQLMRRAIGEQAALMPVLVTLIWAVVVGGVGIVVQSRRDRVMADLI